MINKIKQTINLMNELESEHSVITIIPHSISEGMPIVQIYHVRDLISMTDNLSDVDEIRSEFGNIKELSICKEGIRLFVVTDGIKLKEWDKIKEYEQNKKMDAHIMSAQKKGRC